MAKRIRSPLVGTHRYLIHGVQVLRVKVERVLATNIHARRGVFDPIRRVPHAFVRVISKGYQGYYAWRPTADLFLVRAQAQEMLQQRGAQ